MTSITSYSSLDVNSPIEVDGTNFPLLGIDEVIAYELGIRTSLLGRAAQLSAATFYYDHKDKQRQENSYD